MRAILDKLNKEDAGAASIVEMTLIFPLVVVTLCFLLYTGFYILQATTMHNDAQRIAVIASKEAAMPGYIYLYNGTDIPSTADFAWPEEYVPDEAIINNVMGEHKIYRYWSDNFISATAKEKLRSDFESLVARSSFLGVSNISCKIYTKNNILNQTIEVVLENKVNAPAFLDLLGVRNAFDIKVTAVATVGDSAEFIRNTNMIFDFKDYIFENLKIGEDGQTINDKIATYKQKFIDMKNKLGLSF